MPVIVAGVDEAGYGPLLGPLCVGVTGFRVHGWSPGDPAPDLWRLLRGAVCEKPNDPKQRLPVADSKKLKGSNQLKRRHPLCHLERSVLAFMRTMGVETGDDCGLFTALGVACGDEPWHGGRVVLPLDGPAERVGIDAAMLRRAMFEAGVEPLVMRCRVVRESAFNATVRRTGTKASTTMGAVAAHLRQAALTWRGEHVRFVCDRLGGRTRYGGVLERAFGKIAGRLGEATVEALEETDRVSVYEIRFGAGAGTGEGSFRVLFMPEAERQHLPVALASMTAKLVRELAMARFNAYWAGVLGEIKPTAGYTADARRWLTEAGDRLDAGTRARLTRIA